MLRKRILNAALALGLVTGLFVGALAPAAAAPENPGRGMIFFPWVPNNDTIAGIEGVTGSVTVQNVEIFPVDVVVSDAAGNELASLTLNPRASQTWEADELGIAEPGAGVVATADWNDLDDLIDTGICRTRDFSFTHAAAGGIDSQSVGGQVNAVSVSQGDFVFPTSSYTWQHNGGILSIDWSPSGAEPAANSGYTVTVLRACPTPRIAGVEKHTVGTVGVRTSSATTAVDGYSAVPLRDVANSGDGGADLEGQSRWVLPIVQTNSGWNSEIVITNISGANTSVSATFYAAEGQGVAGPSTMLLSGKVLKPGDSVAVDLTEDAGFPEDVVGSIWVDSTQPVVAGVFRMKAESAMMLTNVAQPRRDGGSPTKYGPLVFRDYNGWNTGINIANLSSANNQVSVTYYNYAGNVVASDTLNIPARAMEYVYTPATGEFGLAESQVTAVRIDGSQSLVAAIDEVKYLGGQGQGHAMSYPAARDLDADDMVYDTDEVIIDGRWFYGQALSLPLVQKGNPNTGSGDTSGINLFNADTNDTANVYVQFLDPSGVPVAPTVAANDAEAPLVFPLAPHAGATIYTLKYGEMPAGFQGSAVIGIGDEGNLVGVSNNVNYGVAGDGSAVFNLVRANYDRFDNVVVD